MSLKVIFKDTYDMLMTEDGVKAIALAQEHDIDVAILDIRMAGMSGIEVLERLRMVRPDLEAIMITAFETTDTIRSALRLRACDYINKPFDIATIRSAVSQAMQRRVSDSEIHNSAEKVHELLAELQNQRVEEQIAKTRGDIYASIIHDINGPLTVISGFVQLLNKKLGSGERLEPEDQEFVKERLNIIERQVGNCIEISRRYLGFLRRQTDGSSPHAGVNQLLRDLEQLVRVHPSLQDNEFQLTPFTGDISVKINGIDLIQMMLNLIVNGCEAMASVDPAERHLRVSVQGGGDGVQVVVQDRGVGLPMGHEEFVFKPFFTTKPDGLGLGLAIAKTIVSAHGGQLVAEHNVGAGATFRMTLPACEPAGVETLPRASRFRLSRIS